MRQPHPSYKGFIKEQAPKYGVTFIDWYAANRSIGDKELLDILHEQRRTVFEDGFNKRLYFNGDKEMSMPSYFLDILPKKLQLCSNLIRLKSSYDNVHPQRMAYGLDKTADIMDFYEDIIFEICTMRNVGVCAQPSGFYHNGSMYTTAEHTFRTFDELKEELKTDTGEVIIYFFVVNDDLSIMVRMAKREPLTRKVITEKDSHRQ